MAIFSQTREVLLPKVVCCYYFYHLIIRGTQDDPFRGAYEKIGHLRGFVRCPLLCLTATAGTKTRREILKTLSMRNVKVVKFSPDKPNCKFFVEKASGDIEQQFNCLVDELMAKKTIFQKQLCIADQ